MKKIVLIAALVSFAVLSGCGRRGAAQQGSEAGKETAVAVDSHDHAHAAGEACESTADAHEGHAHAEGDGHDHAAHAEKEVAAASAETAEASDEIVFPATQAARTDFEVQQVKRGEFRETLRCGGDISVSQSEVSVVSAPIAGVVTFVDGRVMSNSTVVKGQGLFRLSSGGLASGDAVTKAQIAFRQAESDFERIKALYADKLVTQRDYLAAEAEYLRTKAEYDPIKVTDGNGTLIKAPTAGYVLQLSVAPGDYVEMGQPLATIAKSGRMQLRAFVSQRYFDRLPGISDANFKISTSNDYYTVSKLGGKLFTSGRTVSPGSTLIPVVFEFDAGGQFPNGVFADIVLLGRQRADVLTLPLSAITEQQGLYYVYVQLDPDCYRRQQVWLGTDDGVQVEIVKGLNGSERVVTKGAVNVKMASASGAIPHGHAH